MAETSDLADGGTSKSTAPTIDSQDIVEMTMTDPTSTTEHAALTSSALGCLLGGAVGDALGAGIEFDTWRSIVRRHGPNGVTDFVGAYGCRGAITDDTQMTMFTAEGLIRASVRQKEKGICDAPSVVRHAYLRWLWTQGDPRPLRAAFTEDPDGWLIGIDALHSRRAPGITCTGALTEGGGGAIDRPLNDSKGCGGVMRAAPVGLATMPIEEQFRLGCEIAVLTHGNPSGYLPAGYLAAVVGAIVDGADLGDALDAADAILRTWDRSTETIRAVDAGRRLGGERDRAARRGMDRARGARHRDRLRRVRADLRRRRARRRQPLRRQRLDRVHRREHPRSAPRGGRHPRPVARPTRTA
jgi:ADP-ribosylglycohydrolase